MTSDLENSRLVALAELLYHQLTSSGKLGIGMRHDEKSWFTPFFEARLQFVSRLLQILEAALNLRFAANETPLVYNTAKWPEQGRLGGYSRSQEIVRPSELLVTFVGNWKMDTEANGSTGQRILRAALHVCQDDGFAAALKFTVDVQEKGFTISTQSVYFVLKQLLNARAKVDSDDEVAKFILGEALTFGSRDVQEIRWRTAAEDYYEPGLLQILEIILDKADETRAARSYDEWILDQWQLTALGRQWQVLVSDKLQANSGGLKAVSDQIEEIKADGGALQVMCARPDGRCPYRADFVVTHAFMKVFGMQFPDWEQRIVRERVLIPQAIQSEIMELREEDIPDHWNRLSVDIAPAFAHAVCRAPFFAQCPVTATQTDDHAEMLRQYQATMISAMSPQVEPEKKVEIFRGLLEERPWCNFIHHELAIAYDSLGDGERAWNHIQQAILAAPEAPGLWQSASVILSRQGHRVESMLAVYVENMNQKAREAG